jgi:hypothetical protein
LSAFGGGSRCSGIGSPCCFNFMTSSTTRLRSNRANNADGSIHHQRNQLQLLDNAASLRCNRQCCLKPAEAHQVRQAGSRISRLAEPGDGTGVGRITVEARPASRWCATGMACTGSASAWYMLLQLQHKSKAAAAARRTRHTSTSRQLPARCCKIQE